MSNPDATNTCGLCGRDLTDAVPYVEFTLWSWPNDELIKFCAVCVDGEPTPHRMAELLMQIVDATCDGAPRLAPGHA